MTELRDWLLQLASETMEQEGVADASHDYDHIVRVTALAETIQARDLPTIWAAVAFHDLGQERERRHGGDHAQIGAGMAGDILAATQFPQQAIPAVQRASLPACTRRLKAFSRTSHSCRDKADTPAQGMGAGSPRVLTGGGMRPSLCGAGAEVAYLSLRVDGNLLEAVLTFYLKVCLFPRTCEGLAPPNCRNTVMAVACTSRKRSRNAGISARVALALCSVTCIQRS
jgi:hypothetical protein